VAGEATTGLSPAAAARSTALQPRGILALIATGNDELVRSSFDAFLRSDWNALAEVMHPGVV
jgi:hypothetical protein